MKGRLSGHEYPRELEFIEAVPKSASGKILRRLLRDLAEVAHWVSVLKVSPGAAEDPTLRIEQNPQTHQIVLWCLGELEVPFERYDVGGLYGGNKEPEFLERNPTGLVPMISDDGFDLWESNSIVRYLAARYGAGILSPEDPAGRASAEKWMDYQLGTVFPAFKDAILGLIRTPLEEDRDREKISASVKATAEVLVLLDDHALDALNGLDNQIEHAIETYSGILDLDPTDWTAISAVSGSRISK